MTAQTSRRSDAHPRGQHRIEQVRIHPENDPPDRSRRWRHPTASKPSPDVFIQVSDPFGDPTIGPGAGDDRRQRQAQHRFQLEPEPLPAPRVRQNRQHLDQVK